MEHMGLTLSLMSLDRSFSIYLFVDAWLEAPLDQDKLEFWVDILLKPPRPPFLLPWDRVRDRFL